MGAPVSIIVYSDFDCDLCAAFAESLLTILSLHPLQIRYTYRPYPLLQVNEKSAQAAAAFLAIDPEYAFMLHDALFTRRAEWRDLSSQDFRTWLISLAGELGQAQDSFADRMSSPATIRQIEQSVLSAQASGVPGVPFILINGKPHLVGTSAASLETAVRLELLPARQLPPPDFQDDGTAQDFVDLNLNRGLLRLRLLPKNAPLAVASFLHLSEQGWYDGSAFYRVIPNRWLEAGDPSNTGLGDPGYHFEREITPDMEFDKGGLVGLMNDGPGTNSARFFITLSPRPDLSGSATLFAEVIAGMDILQQAPARDPIDDIFSTPFLIIQDVEVVSP